MSNEMTIRQDDEHAMASPMFTEAQEAMIREMFAPTASDLEFRVLISIARARRLNPLLGQIHFVKRKTKIKEQDERGKWTERWEDKWSCQVAIDGLRTRAESTGLYDGQDEPVYTREDGELCARVRVYKKGVSRAFVGVAFWKEFVQTYGMGGDPVRMWTQMPRHMLAKCAEALALRKAFPEELAGIYSPEEMGQSENDRSVQRKPIEARPKLAPIDEEAIALRDRARGAASIDACEEILRVSGKWYGVRAHAYGRMIALGEDEYAVTTTVGRIDADKGLPEAVASKLHLEAQAKLDALRAPPMELDPDEAARAAQAAGA